MTKLILIGLLVLAAVVLAVWSLILKAQRDNLDKREVSLNEMKERIDHERNILTSEQNALKERYAEIAPWVNGKALKLNASYVVTESDEMKYNTDLAIRNVARNRIAHNIAFDIIKQIPEPECHEVDGRKVYSYRLKVMEEK